MKRFILFIIAILAIDIAMSQNTWDFSAVAPTGQTLYYKIVNGDAHLVKPMIDNSPIQDYYPSGDLVIPSTVTNNGLTYNVTAMDSVFYHSVSLNVGPFYSCGLTSVTIPNTVTNISCNTFRECTGLSFVTIGSSVTHIGEYAFYGCIRLFEIVSNATNAPSIPIVYLTSTAFQNVPITARIHVPCGCLDSYYSQWTNFVLFIEDATSGHAFAATSADSSRGSINILYAPTCQTPIASVFANAADGFRFDHWSDGNADNPRTLTLTTDSTIIGYFDSVTYLVDTTYINIHDTTFLHDTIYLPVYVHDTVIMPDTVVVSVTVHDTIIAYVNVPVHDTVFAYIEVPVHDTLWLTQYDTIWMYDTIIVHDTIYITQEGIDGADAMNAKVYSNNGQIVVEGADGNTVTLYDVNGRVLATKQDDYMPLRFDIHVSGTYMIKIGNYPARKVVVIR